MFYIGIAEANKADCYYLSFNDSVKMKPSPLFFPLIVLGIIESTRPIPSTPGCPLKTTAGIQGVLMIANLNLNMYFELI